MSSRAATDHQSRRTLGAYYSPESYARALVVWALNGSAGTVLDPSYGGCAFLRVAIEELTKLGNQTAASHAVYGADVDTATATWASHLASQGVPEEHLVQADFLSLQPGRDLPVVDAIIGNPPYVRHHWLSETAKQVSRGVAQDAGVELSRRASLWAYFILHSCRFLGPGGRLAFILPGAILYADYAVEVRRFIAARFEHAELIRIGERLFDANEESVVLLASGWRPTRERNSLTVDLPVRHAADLSEMVRMLATSNGAQASAGPQMESIPGWKFDVIGTKATALVERLLSHDSMRPLGDRARVTLGCVTGSNSFFVVTDEQWAPFQTQLEGRRILTRNAWLSGPRLTEVEFESVSEGFPRRLLLMPADATVDRRTRLGRYLRLGETNDLPSRRHCQRDPWWSIPQPDVPNALLPYTVGVWRGLSLNSARVLTTNTVHQVFWRGRPTAASSRAVALSTWSSIGCLFAELLGKGLGGGVLKLELTGAVKLPTFDGLDVAESRLTRARHEDGSALALADEVLMASDVGLSDSDIATARVAANFLASQRRRQRTASRDRLPYGSVRSPG